MQDILYVLVVLVTFGLFAWFVRAVRPPSSEEER